MHSWDFFLRKNLAFIFSRAALKQIWGGIGKRTLMQVPNYLLQMAVSVAVNHFHMVFCSHFTLLHFCRVCICTRCCCCCIQLNLHYGYLCRFQRCVVTINVIVCQLDVYFMRLCTFGFDVVYLLYLLCECLSVCIHSIRVTQQNFSVYSLKTYLKDTNRYCETHHLYRNDKTAIFYSVEKFYGFSFRFCFSVRSFCINLFVRFYVSFFMVYVASSITVVPKKIPHDDCCKINISICRHLVQIWRILSSFCFTPFLKCCEIPCPPLQNWFVSCGCARSSDMDEYKTFHRTSTPLSLYRPVQLNSWQSFQNHK